MQVQRWKHVDVGVEFVTTNFWTLFLPLFVCLITHIIIKTRKRLHVPDFVQLSKKEVHKIQDLVHTSGAHLLNKRQCLDLSSKLSKTIGNIEELISQCGSSTDLFRPSLEHLCRVLVRARLLVNDCSRKNWVAASLFHIQNENTFQVILLEVGLCYHAIYRQSKDTTRRLFFQVEDLFASCTFQPAHKECIDEDREVLKSRLEDLVDRRNSSRFLLPYHFVVEKISKNLRLAQYLLMKLDCTSQRSHPDGSELSERIMWTEKSYSFCTWGRDVFLGSGSGASGVSKTRWLGIPCAKKFNIPKPYFLKEAGILFHANHPNIAKFFCCGNGQKGDHFIVMELMEMSLSKLIAKQAKKRIKFPPDVAIDIIAQLARGMCYLHGLKVAHRDLKADNVVVDILACPHIAGNYCVKLVDFGTAKTQVEPFKTTSTDNGFGTITHKAPEVRDLAPVDNPQDRKWRAIWFKADVWSFGITCLQILSLQHEFKQYKDPMIDVENFLPPGYPKGLIALLQECLHQSNPRSRPNFLQICTRLEFLRHNLLRELSTFEQAKGLFEKAKGLFESHKFIEEKIEEHCRIQRENVGIIDAGEASMQHISGILPRTDQTGYYESSRESIRQAIELVKGGKLEFNVSLCEDLTRELSRTEDFLMSKYSVLSGFQGEWRCESRRVALLELYSVVKQAKSLVQKCCKCEDSPWPKRAFLVLMIKEDILDIILHLRWWTSIIDIVIVSSEKRLPSEVEDAEIASLKRADEEFETMLDHLTSSDSELQKAALKDRELLLIKVEEYLRSYNGEPGTSIKENLSYLLCNQIRSVLTDKEAIRIPGLNEFEVVQVIRVGGYGVVSQVKWCSYDAALKTKAKYDHGDRESIILEKLHHPHIVQFFCRLETASMVLYKAENLWSRDQISILMERMPSDLERHMEALMREKPSQITELRTTVGPKRKPPFSNPVAIDIMLQVAKAVWHMHSKNVIHRNLKPSKILVRPVRKDEVPELFALGFLQVKVGGFGDAKDSILSLNKLPLTPKRGTPLYRSPEVYGKEWSEGDNYPHKADSWSFGMMCSQILSGDPPFCGEMSLPLQVTLQRGVRPWIPESCPDYLQFCIESCWKHNPKERPRFSDIWKMLRFAKLRSLGLINQNSNLFRYTDDENQVVELIGTPTNATRMVYRSRKAGSFFRRRIFI